MWRIRDKVRVAINGLSCCSHPQCQFCTALRAHYGEPDSTVVLTVRAATSSNLTFVEQPWACSRGHSPLWRGFTKVCRGTLALEV